MIKPENTVPQPPAPPSRFKELEEAAAEMGLGCCGRPAGHKCCGKHRHAPEKTSES